MTSVTTVEPKKAAKKATRKPAKKNDGLNVIKLSKKQANTFGAIVAGMMPVIAVLVKTFGCPGFSLSPTPEMLVCDLIILGTLLYSAPTLYHFVTRIKGQWYYGMGFVLICEGTISFLKPTYASTNMGWYILTGVIIFSTVIAAMINGYQGAIMAQREFCPKVTKK